jgi:hypothetical protein
MPDAPTMPPVERILSLPPEQAVCIVLAMIGGATWGRRGEDRTDLPMARWVLEADDVGYVHWWDHTQELDDWFLPNPFTDSAAAWDLMVVEVCEWSTDGQTHWFHHPDPRDEYRIGRGPEHSDPKRALVLSVLHKYADDPRYSALIIPLLNRLEESANA